MRGSSWSICRGSITLHTHTRGQHRTQRRLAMEDVGIDVHKNQSQIGAARSPSGAALPSVAERARPQPCDALSQCHRPHPPVAGGQPRSGDRHLLCPASCPGAYDPMTATGFIGIHSSIQPSLCHDLLPILLGSVQRGFVGKHPPDVFTSAHRFLQPLHPHGRAPLPPLRLREDQHWTTAVPLPPHCSNHVVSKN